MALTLRVPLYRGPVGVLPLMQEGRAGVWQMPTVTSDAERRRRRLEMYRQRHEANVRSYDVWTSAMADSQRQQTALLFQRWLDSRCKKTTVSKSKVTKAEALTDDPNTKSTTFKAKRRHTDGEAFAFHHEHLKAVDEPEDDNSGLKSVSKQHKKTENTSSLSTDLHVLDTASADMSVLLSVSKAGIVSKQEGMASEVVSSDVDFGNIDFDTIGFCDIVKTITGVDELNPEFKKCLNESDGDAGSANFSSSDWISLSLSDVMDPVTEKQTMPLHCSSENVPPLQPVAVSFQSSEQRPTKLVEVQSGAQMLPVDNYSMQPWHQVYEPVMPQWQLWPNSVPAGCGELLKYEAVPMKQHASLTRHLPLPEAHRTQNLLHHQQQQPQRNDVQSLYSSYTSAKQQPAQQVWTQQEWQTSSHWSQQLLPCQSIGKCTGPVVKKEMPLSVIVSSDATLRLPSQMLSDNTGLLSHARVPAFTDVAVAAPANQRQQVAVYSDSHPTFVDCNQPSHSLPPHFLANQNQKGPYVSFSQIPDFGLPLNFMPHGGVGELFGQGRSSEANPMVRTVSQGADHNAFPLVSSDMLVSEAHHLIVHENIPANP